MPHLLRSRSTCKSPQMYNFNTHAYICMCYKYIQLPAHIHPPPPPNNNTNTIYTYITGDSLVEKRRKTQQIRKHKRWVFSFDLESERDCLTERGREFQMTNNLLQFHLNLSTF